MKIKGKFTSTQTDVILENVQAMLDMPLTKADATELVLND
jgi:hypothetical protein